ncbi:hypothetical protein PENSUB_5059, partial [Penicillium subrubescens]
MPGLNETKFDFSQTAERLLLQMEQFTFTIHQYGDSANELESKINVDNMENQLGSMLGGMNYQLDDVNEKM